MKKIFKSIVLMSLMLGIAVVGFGGAEAQASSYTATVNPVLNRVFLTPRGHAIKVGDTLQLTTKTKDQNGKGFVGATITFSSSDQTVATVDSKTGLVTGILVGKTTITATAVSGSTTVTTHRTVKVKEIPKGLSQYKGDNKEDNENEGKNDEHLNQGKNQGNNGHQEKVKNEKDTGENEND